MEPVINVKQRKFFPTQKSLFYQVTEYIATITNSLSWFKLGVFGVRPIYFLQGISLCKVGIVLVIYRDSNFLEKQSSFYYLYKKIYFDTI